MTQIRTALKHFWTRDSSILLGGFLLTIFLIVYIWWPLAEEYLKYVDWDGEWWRYMDWLLLGIFGFMSMTIIARANLKTDLLIVFVGICGGLAIESWGTQTNLWHYYTAERPPLWIIPAWPIASLSIDRITRLIGLWTPTTPIVGAKPGDFAIPVLDHLRFFSKPDADLCCPNLRQVLYLARYHLMHAPHPDANRSSFCFADFHRRFRAWILSRVVGHHTRVLDLLHVSNSAVVCSVRTWHGGGRILEGGVNAENDLGEIWFLEASAG